MTTWDTWKEITQFIASARIAFRREKLLWQTIELPAPASATLEVQDGLSVYKVTAAQHLAAIGSDRAILAAALIYSYAVAEAAASAKLSPSERRGGIESWGEKLLATNGKQWSDVAGGKLGCVRAAVGRNAAAHGSYVLDQQLARRLARAGASPLPAAGDPILHSLAEVTQLRSNLKSLLRKSAIK